MQIKKSRSLSSQLILSNVGWIFFVSLLAWGFHSLHVLTLCAFPPIAFSWAISNETRLKKSPLALPPPGRAVKFAFFVTAPIFIVAKMLITLFGAQRENASWGDYFALSFGVAVTICFAYVFYIYVRKRANSPLTK